MNEQHNSYENNDYTFLREKITERPINKRKVIKQSLLTITLAVTFALVACFVFFFFEKGTLNGFSKEQQDSKKIELTLQETTDEIRPEDMIKEDVVEPEIIIPDFPDSSEIIEDVIASYEPDVDDYQGIYNKMKKLAAEASKSLVTVTAIQDKTTWLNSDYESKTKTTGLIIEDNGTDLFILTDANILSNSNEIVVSFQNTQECTATVKAVDNYTGIAILTIPLSELNDTTRSAIAYAALANSQLSCKPGDIVIALGDPLGYGSSIGYGILTSTNTEINGIDHNYQLLTTDIYGSENANGILINKNGKVIGLVNQSFNKSEHKTLVSAVGITELTKLIENLCNDVSRPHMGVSLTNVSSIAMRYYNVPMGAYIIDIEMDSPAMKGGIHKGDVITAMNDAVITSVLDYELELNDCAPGDEVTVTIMRPNGDTYIDMDLKVTLSE
ncbi:MAG: serine protease [Lachnospiraceae bacterium]|nr:serine protease [Lachnospiraceae bacterium]